MHIENMRYKILFGYFLIAICGLLFIGMSQPNNEQTNDVNYYINEPDLNSQLPNIPPNIQKPETPDNGDINNDWAPEPDSDIVINDEFKEPNLKPKPSKKIQLEDFGQTDAQLPFWTQEEAENQAIIEKTPHRKREIDPLKRNDLIEISRILGSMHALRISCLGEGDQTYRSRMNSLLDIEAPSDVFIRDPLILSFNSGFQSQNSGNNPCPKNRDEIEIALAQKGRLLALKMANFYNEKLKK